MANNSKKAPKSAEANTTGATLTNTILLWNGHSVNFVDLPLVSQVALAQRGFTHILGNEVASYEAGLKKKGGLEPDAIAGLGNAKRVEKMNAMAEGTLGQGSKGPRAKGIEKVIAEVAEERIKAACAAKKVPMPKGADLKNTIAKAIERNEAEFKTEAERRMSQTQEVNLDDLI